MKNAINLKIGNIRELEAIELKEINGGVDPFTVGLVLGGLFALWKWVTHK